mmetsp:Transcript_133691/g.198728  ORF Transcript_133691/g.198728 Transcript_133691/m.198728 type:complete len:118 (-) Transcript_133691:1558-1911(-)
MFVRRQINHAQLRMIGKHASQGQCRDADFQTDEKGHPRHAISVGLVATEVHVQRQDETTSGQGHERQKQIKESIIHQSNRIVDKWTVMIKDQNAFSHYAAVFRAEGSGDVAGMAKGL